MSDTEIAENLNEIRLEKALAAELQLTQQIIKKTGIFDPTDRIYGDPDAKYDYSQAEGGEDGPGGGGMPGGGMDMGSGIDDLGGPDGADVGGEEETMDLGGAPEADAGEPVAESRGKKENLVTEIIKYGNMPRSYFDEYMKKINEGRKNEETTIGRVESVNENFVINEELNSIVNELDEIISDEKLDKMIDEQNKGEVGGVLGD